MIFCNCRAALGELERKISGFNKSIQALEASSEVQEKYNEQILDRTTQMAVTDAQYSMNQQTSSERCDARAGESLERHESMMVRTQKIMDGNTRLFEELQTKFKYLEEFVQHQLSSDGNKLQTIADRLARIEDRHKGKKDQPMNPSKATLNNHNQQ